MGGERQKKKMLIAINTMGRGGAERALLSMLAFISPEEYAVDLVAVIPRGVLFAQVPENVNIINGDWSAEPVLGAEGRKYLRSAALKRLFSKGYVFKNLPYFFRYFFAHVLKKKVRMEKLLWKPLADTTPKTEKEYDLAVAYLEGAATYYVADHVSAQKKAAFLHIDYQLAGYIKEFDKPYYDKIDKIFCVSNDLKESFSKIFPEYGHKTDVMHNIIPREDIISKAESGGGFDDGFDGIRLLTASRLHVQKGIDFAVEAFALLKSGGRYDNVRWYVLGEGDERADIERRIRNHGLHESFILCGAKDNPYPYFKQCDVYVQTSRWEGRAIVLSEALVLEKPVVTTRVMSVEEQILDGETGIIVDLSAESIADALQKIIDDDELRARFVQNIRALPREDGSQLEKLLSMCE